MKKNPRIADILIKKRTGSDPNISIANIFGNKGTSNRTDDSGTTHTCPSGYTPAAGDGQILKFSVIDGATTTLCEWSPSPTQHPA